jgi:hypothetical protein
MNMNNNKNPLNYWAQAGAHNGNGNKTRELRKQRNGESRWARGGMMARGRAAIGRKFIAMVPVSRYRD